MRFDQVEDDDVLAAAEDAELSFAARKQTQNQMKKLKRAKALQARKAPKPNVDNFAKLGWGVPESQQEVDDVIDILVSSMRDDLQVCILDWARSCDLSKCIPCDRTIYSL